MYLKIKKSFYMEYNKLLCKCLLAVMTIMVLVACKSNINEPELMTKEVITLSVNSEVFSRTTLQEDGNGVSANWAEGDKLYVFNSIPADINNLVEFTLVNGAGTKTATFQGTVSGPSERLYAVYGDKLCLETHDRGILFELNNSKFVSTPAELAPYDVLYGIFEKQDNANYECSGMKHGGALFRFRIGELTPGTKIKQVSLTGNSSVCHTIIFRADMSSFNAINVIGATPDVVYKNDEGIVVDEEGIATFCVIMAPKGSGTGSVTLSLTTENGTNIEKQLNFSAINQGRAYSVNIGVKNPDEETSSERYCYLDNGKIKVGVDLSTGGCIHFVGNSGSDVNLINHKDNGRYIQQSFYGEADGSVWGGKDWVWNPIQGGGCGVVGNPKSKVIDKIITANEIYAKTIPTHWATGESVNDLVLEEYISLDEDVIHIKYKVENIGDVNHKPNRSELPAVFIDYNYGDMVFYYGDKPWTGDELKYFDPKQNNTRFEGLKEHWVAFLNENGTGIGVFFPESDDITCYRKGDGTKTGPKGSDCSYFAPVKPLAISVGFKYEYNVYITLGDISKIRENFYKINNK